MAHTNDGSPPRQAEETQVTTRQPKRKRHAAAATGVTAGGVGLGVGLATGALDPEVTSAVLAVVTVTVAAVRYLMRRPAAAHDSTGPSLVKEE